MTVAMSDHDYGLLVQAVGWIEYHAGRDAPEYPHLGALSSVVDCIAKRREPGLPGTRMVVYLSSADDENGTGHAAGSLEVACFDCGGRVPIPAEGGKTICAACGLTVQVTDRTAMGRHAHTGATPDRIRAHGPGGG